MDDKKISVIVLLDMCLENWLSTLRATCLKMNFL